MSTPQQQPTKLHLTSNRLLSRVAAWDNGYKHIGFQYQNEPPERDPDMMSIASFQSRQSISNSVRSPSMSRPTR